VRREKDKEDDFGVGRADNGDDDARSIHTIVPHKLEGVDEVDEEQLAKQEWEEERLQQDDEDEERHARRAELGRSMTPEPTGLGMTCYHHACGLDK